MNLKLDKMVECALCKKSFKNLSNHLTKTHKVSLEEYRTEHGETSYKRKTVFLIRKRFLMAPTAGLEPANNRLTDDCSTTELSRNNTYWSPVPELNRCTRICSPLHEPLCQPANWLPFSQSVPLYIQ